MKTNKMKNKSNNSVTILVLFFLLMCTSSISFSQTTKSIPVKKNEEEKAINNEVKPSSDVILIRHPRPNTESENLGVIKSINEATEASPSKVSNNKKKSKK